MSESAALIVSIVGTGIGIVGVLGLMLRMLATNMARQFDATGKRIDATGKRIDDLKTDMNRQFGETSKRLDRIETRLSDTNKRIDGTNKRIDDVGRDIADLRDRTGVLEGTLSTFMNERRNRNAA